jgi:hypothetical protein
VKNDHAELYVEYIYLGQVSSFSARYSQMMPGLPRGPTKVRVEYYLVRAPETCHLEIFKNWPEFVPDLLNSDLLLQEASSATFLWQRVLWFEFRKKGVVRWIQSSRPV